MMEKFAPKLRFPGFTENWIKKTIQNISTKITDGTHDTPKPQNSGIPFLTAIHVKDGQIDLENCYYLTKEDHLKIYSRCNPELGDLLMVNIGSGTATSARVNFREQFSLKNVALIKPNFKLVNSHFFEQVQRMNSSRLKHQISSGGAQPFLSLKEIGKLKLNLPTLPEQQKIATFLTTVDEKINLLKNQKIELERYKKGVMQKIFSQELRFKDDDGKEFPKWEKSKLKDVAQKKSSNIAANTIEDNNGEFIVYGASGELKRINFYQEENDYISIVKDGAGVGRLLYCNGKSSVLGTLEKISPISKMNTYFLFSILSNIDFTKYVTGSTIPHIYFKDYSNESIKFPCLVEQTKIANFLSALDEKIALNGEQITKMEVWKKGLLQQMFV